MKFLVVAVLLFPFVARAQRADTSSDSIVSRGKFSGHTRSFFMSTINQGGLKDYHAFVAGIGMGYETAEFKRFKVGISGAFAYNLASSDLSKPDPESKTFNRYEVGLLNIVDHGNQKQLVRLEELFIQYRINKSFLRAGKLNLTTPFINPQDGRMRPTVEQGFWAEVNEIKNVKLEGGYLTHISPRSTVKWYRIGESIGIYPSGVGVSGIPSDYAGNLTSKGIYLLGFNYKKKAASFTFWNTFIENISNTTFFQMEQKFQNDRFYAGLQYIRQDAVGDGGNANEAQTYMNPRTYSNTLSSRVGILTGTLQANLNATIIAGNGRFLMPREWGREPFYTFLPRERNEGAGRVKAVSANVTYTIPEMRLKSCLGIGRYVLPSVRDYHLNKYAMPSYTQLNADVRYDFNGVLDGTNIQMLYVYKLGTGNHYENPKNIVNKINMSNVNIVLNYKFAHHHALRKVPSGSQLFNMRKKMKTATSASYISSRYFLFM